MIFPASGKLKREKFCNKMLDFPLSNREKQYIV